MNRANPIHPLFENQVLANLLQEPVTYTTYKNIWKRDYFSGINHHSTIAHAFITIRAYGEHPTQEAMAHQLLKEYDENHLPQKVEDMIKELDYLYSIPVNNNTYGIEEVAEWQSNVN